MNVKMVSVPNAEIILKFQKCKEIISRLGVKVVKQWLKIVKCYVLTATVAKVTIDSIIHKTILKAEGHIERFGAAKGGYWKINE